MPTQDELTTRVSDLAAERDIPLTAHLDLTAACNHGCAHCYRLEQPRAELSTEEVCRVLEELQQLGSFFLTLSGGEVTLRQDLLEILARAQQLRFCVRLKTNAFKLAPELPQKLRELGVAYVDVSLYGARPEAHDRVTGVAGSWRRTTDNIKKISATGIQVNIKAQVFNINHDEMSGLHPLAESLGAAGVDISHLLFPRLDGDAGPLELAVTTARADELRQQLIPEGSPSATVVDHGQRLCGAAHNLIYVNPYGDVMPCVTFPIVCGNVKTQPLKEIWRSAEPMLQVRQATIDDAGLTEGGEKRFSHCPGRAYITCGDFLAPDGWGRK